MSDTTPNIPHQPANCPNCGAPQIGTVYGGVKYACGSAYGRHDPYVISRSLECAAAQNQQERDALRSEVEQLKQSVHYCNGTADLAIQHRDAAEAEATELRETLADLAEHAASVDTWPSMEGPRGILWTFQSVEWAESLLKKAENAKCVVGKYTPPF
jgi:hypothetical protein